MTQALGSDLVGLGAGRAHPRERDVLRRPRRSGWRGSATGWPSASRAAGRLVAFGRSPAARSDARHVAVEFVHPVIVGKRALPAIGLAGEGGPLARAGGAARASRTTSRSASAPARRWRGRAAVALARERGCLTLAFAPAGAEWEFDPPGWRPVGPAGARGDALPRAVGARARVLRPPRAARGPRGAAGARHRRVELPLSVPGRERGRPRGGGRGRAPLGARQGGGGRRAARADADRQPRRADRRGRRAAARTSTRAAGCWRSATAARPPTRWTWWPTSGSRRSRAGRRGARWT